MAWLKSELINPNNDKSEFEPSARVYEQWVTVDETFVWHEEEVYENNEVGAYTTWYNDPSNSVMLHYITIDDSPVVCLYRKEGDLTWGVVALFEDKSFPNTSNRVRWFKL